MAWPQSSALSASAPAVALANLTTTTAEPGARPVVRCRPGRHVRRRRRAAAIGRATRRPRLDGSRGPGCPPLPGQPGDLVRGSHRSSHPGSHGAAPLDGGGGRVAGRHRAATPVHRRRHPGLLDDVRPGCADAAAHLGHHLPLPRSRAHAGLRGDRTFGSGHGGTPGHHPAGRHLRLGRHRRGRGRHRCCLQPRHRPAGGAGHRHRPPLRGARIDPLGDESAHAPPHHGRAAALREWVRGRSRAHRHGPRRPARPARRGHRPRRPRQLRQHRPHLHALGTPCQPGRCAHHHREWQPRRGRRHAPVRGGTHLPDRAAGHRAAGRRRCRGRHRLAAADRGPRPCRAPGRGRRRPQCHHGLPRTARSLHGDGAHRHRPDRRDRWPAHQRGLDGSRSRHLCPYLGPVAGARSCARPRGSAAFSAAPPAG